MGLRVARTVGDPPRGVHIFCVRGKTGRASKVSVGVQTVSDKTDAKKENASSDDVRLAKCQDANDER